MSSYLPSFRRAPSAPVDDAPLSSLPACELTPLTRLEAALHADIFAPTSTLLHPGDPWRALAPPNRRALALRFLRFHLLQEAAALEHARRVAAWRAADRPWERPLKAMAGPAAGLPVLPLHAPGRNGDVLVYSAARAYVRAQVNHAAQEEAVKTFFESTFYAQGAQTGLSAVVVLDFHGMSMSNVDLVGTKNGIRIFADFYPDVFSKVLVVNYARWLHGTWKCIAQLLDARTVRKVMFLSDTNQMREELSKSFAKADIPRWLGGDAGDGALQLYCGATVDPDEVAKTMQAKS